MSVEDRHFLLFEYLKGEKIMIKIRNYSSEDLDYIKDNYAIQTVKQIAEYLGKTESSIYNAIRKLGLAKQKHKSWSVEENDFLKENYLAMTNTELAKKLNRTFNSVSAQMDRLGLVRNKPWSFEDEQYLIDNFKNMSHKELGAVLGRTEEAVRAKCFDMDLYKKEIPWSEFELDFLTKYYKEMSNKEISRVLNRTESAIHLQASRMGIKKYPYFCDYHYFDEIDTEEKAYWLGFLAADGWISKNEKTNSGVVGIELQYSDNNHLKKFNKSISGNYQITDRWKTSPVHPDKKNHICVIRIFSITMYDTLYNIGFSNNKSFDFEIPELRKDLIRHFIRGYFDGDGCFTLTNKSFSISFITASEKLNNSIIEILNQENIHISEFDYVNDHGTKMFRPSIYPIQDKMDFLNYIYKDCNIYLDRKYKKYLKAKEKYNATNGLAA